MLKTMIFWQGNPIQSHQIVSHSSPLPPIICHVITLVCGRTPVIGLLSQMDQETEGAASAL